MTEVSEPSDNPFLDDPSSSISPSSPLPDALSSSSPALTNGHHTAFSHEPSSDQPSSTSPPSPEVSSDDPPAVEEEAEPSVPPIDFALSHVPDASAPLLSSISSLSTSLSSIYSDFASLHRSRLAAYHERLRSTETQQRELQSSIDHLRASLARLSTERALQQSALSSLRSSVSSSQSTVASTQAALDDAALRLTHLHSKASKRHQHRHRPLHLTLSTFLVRPSPTGLRRIAVPLVAVDRIFTFLPVRDVDSCARTCRLWQQVIDRSRVWPLSMRRILHNKRKKEREVEDGGEQITKDEFDDWRQSALDTLDAPLPSPDRFQVVADEGEPEKPVEEFVLSKAGRHGTELAPARPARTRAPALRTDGGRAEGAVRGVYRLPACVHAVRLCGDDGHAAPVAQRPSARTTEDGDSDHLLSAGAQVDERG